jgi:hypothetical protein
MLNLPLHYRQTIGHDPSLTPGLTGGDFLTETWFIALLGSMVAVMVLLFAAMLLVRRRQLLTKKSTLSNIRGKMLQLDNCDLHIALPITVTFILQYHNHNS